MEVSLKKIDYIQPRRNRLNRFDIAVWVTIALLISATIVLSLWEWQYPQQVAYLHPVRDGIQNVWLAPSDNPNEAQQVTFSETGIYNFDVSPDGRFLAYAERDRDTGLTDLWLLDLYTRATTRLTNCIAEDADCKTPVFNGTGNIIAYERLNTNRNLPNLGPGAIRIWLVDITQQPYATSPLTDNTAIIGHSPQWSQDNTSIAFYNADIANPSIFIYVFNSDDGERKVQSVPSFHGTVGSLSPNGNALIYPEIVTREGGIFTHLRLANLNTLESVDLTDANGNNDDPDVVWHPDGKRAAIGRRYTDERYTPGFQIYIIDVETKAVAPLVVDEHYSHGFFSWDANGERLVIQRFPLSNADGSPAIDASPEIWMYDLLTGDLSRIASDAFFPRWVNGN